MGEGSYILSMTTEITEMSATNSMSFTPVGPHHKHTHLHTQTDTQKGKKFLFALNS